MTKTEILKVIKQHCLDCCYDQVAEVQNCPCSSSCALWAYRLGKDPNPRVLSPAEKARRAELMRAIVEKREKQKDTAGE